MQEIIMKLLRKKSILRYLIMALISSIIIHSFFSTTAFATNDFKVLSYEQLALYESSSQEYMNANIDIYEFDLQSYDISLFENGAVQNFYGEVIFSKTNWGAYHEFLGNYVALSVAFTDENGNLIPDVGMKVSLARYGNNIVDASVFAWGNNQSYSTTGNDIIPNYSYRLCYQLTTNYTGAVKARVAIISYNK